MIGVGFIPGIWANAVSEYESFVDLIIFWWVIIPVATEFRNSGVVLSF